MSDGADATLPDEFREIVDPVAPEFPDIGEIQTTEAVRHASVEAAAVATYYRTLVQSDVPERTAARLTRDYAEERAWLAAGDEG